MPKDQQRLCRRCREPIGIDDDICAACGERNPVTMPWWGPFAGAAIIVLVAYFLVDFTPLLNMIGRLLD